jgi:shikimate kinase
MFLQSSLVNVMWISFVGFLASGKSAVAGVLSQITRLPAVDLDREVERREGATLPEIFRLGGADRFRAAEARVLQGLDPERPLLVATGAGTLDRHANSQRLCEGGLVIWLDAPWEVLRARIEGAGEMYGAVLAHLGWSGLETLYRRRLRLYGEAADFRLRTLAADVGQVSRAALLRSLLWKQRGGEACR